MTVLEDVLCGDGKLEELGLVGLVEDGCYSILSPVHDGNTLLPNGLKKFYIEVANVEQEDNIHVYCLVILHYFQHLQQIIRQPIATNLHQSLRQNHGNDL